MPTTSPKQTTRLAVLMSLLPVVALILTPACSRDDPTPTATPLPTSGTTVAEPCRDRGRATTGTTSIAIVDAAAPSGPASVRGTITDGTCGTPIAGIKVLLLDDALQTKLVGATTTKSDGTYDFGGIAARRYRVEFFDPTSTYATTFFRSVPDFDEAETIDLALTPVFTRDERLYTAAQQPVPDYRGHEGGQKVAVIGDSLVQQTTGALRDKLEPLGPTSVLGISLQRTDQMLPTARKFAPSHPDVVIVALGNNDLLEGRSKAETIGHLGDLIDLFPGARCVEVVNVNSHTGQDDFNARANELNRELRRLSIERPQVKLIDWDEDVRLLLTQSVSPSAWFSDTLHLTPLGAGAYATAMQGAVQRCL